MVLVAVSLPLAVLSIDFTGVVVALPEVGAALDAPSADLAWVVNAFALGFAGPLLVVGKVSDELGHRRVLLAGMTLFAIGSATCGLAPAFGVLVAGRFVQGLGTAGAMTASLALVADAYAGDARTTAIGRWSAVGGTASAVGPLVAGALTAALSWRAFFFVNLPLLAVAVVLTLRATVAPPRRRIGKGFDGVGAVTSAVGLVLVVLGLVNAADAPLWSPAVALPLGLGVVALATLVRHERRAADPLVPPDLFVRRAFQSPVRAATVANVGFGALELLVTLYLQDLRGWGPLETGVAFLVYSVPFAVVGAAMGRLGARWSVTALATGGLAVVATSFAVLALIGVLPGVAIVGALGLAGVGQGLVYSASSAGAMGAVTSAEEGAGSAVLGVGRNLGLSVGIALASLASVRADELTTGMVVLSLVLALGCSLVTVLRGRAAPS